MEPSFRVQGIDHVTVTTPAELESEVLEWYRTCLELEEIPKPEGARPHGSWFRAGEQEIHISIAEHNPHKAAHFGIVVNDFDAIVECLRANKCHIEQARPIPGRHRCYTADPAGNRIELIVFDEVRASVTYQEVVPETIVLPENGSP